MSSFARLDDRMEKQDMMNRLERARSGCKKCCKLLMLILDLPGFSFESIFRLAFLSLPLDIYVPHISHLANFRVLASNWPPLNPFLGFKNGKSQSISVIRLVSE